MLFAYHQKHVYKIILPKHVICVSKTLNSMNVSPQHLAHMMYVNMQRVYDCKTIKMWFTFEFLNWVKGWTIIVSLHVIWFGIISLDIGNSTPTIMLKIQFVGTGFCISENAYMCSCFVYICGSCFEYCGLCFEYWSNVNKGPDGPRQCDMSGHV